MYTKTLSLSFLLSTFEGIILVMTFSLSHEKLTTWERNGLRKPHFSTRKSWPCLESLAAHQFVEKKHLLPLIPDLSTWFNGSSFSMNLLLLDLEFFNQTFEDSGHKKEEKGVWQRRWLEKETCCPLVVVIIQVVVVQARCRLKISSGERVFGSNEDRLSGSLMSD